MKEVQDRIDDRSCSLFRQLDATNVLRRERGQSRTRVQVETLIFSVSPTIYVGYSPTEHAWRARRLSITELTGRRLMILQLIQQMGSAAFSHDGYFSRPALP